MNGQALGQQPPTQPGQSPSGQQPNGQPGQPPSGQQTGRSGNQPGSDHSSDSGAPDQDQFQQMLERMLDRKRDYLDQLPGDNAGRIRGLREYDFLSPEAREAFEQLVGGMQRDLMEQYFQGLKQGIGNLSQQDMDGIRQMVRDLNEMLDDLAIAWRTGLRLAPSRAIA